MRANRAPASPGKIASQTHQSPGGDSNSHASGARASEARASAIPPPGELSSSPCGNRTRLSSLRGWCPEPIDERTFIENRQWVVKELNLPPSASQLGGNGFTDRREGHHPRKPVASSTGGSRTHRHPGLSRAALPVCVPCRLSHFFSAPGGIRTRDLLADNEASTPGCSTKA
jgi:hypothetical protein